MKKSIFLLLFISINIFGQSITISPNGSASLLDVQSTTNGILVPRMSQDERLAIVNPSMGLMVFQTDNTAGFFVNKSSIPAIPNWSRLAEGTAWSTGFSSINDIFSPNSGRVGIGTANPAAKLDIFTNTDDHLNLTNQSSPALDIKSTLNFKNSIYYTAKILTIGLSANNARLGFFTGVNLTSTNLQENMTIANNGFVGIKNINPEAVLHVGGTDSEKLRLHNTSTLAANISSELFFKTGGIFTGALKTIGQSNANARLGLFTSAGLNTSDLLERLSILDDGKVGIGTVSPAAQLTVFGPNGINGIAHTNGTTTLATSLDASAGWFGTTTTHSLKLTTNNSAKVTILSTGEVGIGTASPSTYILDINGRARIRHNSATAGLWFNKSDNTEGAFTGMFDNDTYGFFGMGAVANWRFGFDLTNTRMGIGTMTPKHPLTFPNSVGDKISFWGGNTLNTDNHYGIGIQGSVLQFYVPTTSENLVFGIGRSGAFTEKMRISGGGNVGIGSTNPALAGLIVDKAVGNANAIFGSNTSGVSIESNFPGVSLNGYYSGGRKPISTGFVGGISMNPTNGLISIYNSTASGIAGSIVTATDKFFINNQGNVGIGTSTPNASLSVIRGTGVDGTAAFFGTTWASHFNYSTSEDTYIRGGKSGSKVIINDISGLGNVGIGTSNPGYKLQVNTTGDSPGIVHANNVGIQVGTYLGSNAGWLGTFSNHPLYFFVNNGGSAVTITTSEQLQVGSSATPVGYKMSVDGKVICTELEVLTTPWPDYVFKPTYKLKPLNEVENFIQQNGHLPNIPKAEDIENKSLALGNMSKLQMEKIEELTLYLIEINKRLKKVEDENEVLKKELKSIKSQN
ncbi:hypothetical protein EMA8858_03772 [Emticicia aquatica]|uniref:Uncharacterized protein n=1 Tax=Emticicia aquatica TaxID=1681835 RepID=A0ABM9AUC8_9BACT|nr:hypothetical protein [Emticicia aquatica]CAH0997638.1 hypothetical protein EMA8858_03772 [Emticicia aquatica]